MAEDKQEKIISELKRRAEEMRFGTITVEFKIHEGKLAKGDIIEKRETLG
jgi:hypothetical protein